MIDWKYFTGEKVILVDGRIGEIGAIFECFGLPKYDIILQNGLKIKIGEKYIKNKIGEKS